MGSVHKPKPRSQSVRNFKAYYPTDINKLTSAYRDGNLSRIERLVSDTSIGRAIVEKLVVNVVGEGIVPNASPESTFLDWSDETRNKYITQAEAYWRAVANNKKIDFYERYNIAGLQRIALRNIIVKGDVLMQRIYDKRSLFPKVRLIGGQWVQQPNGTMDTTHITGGVQLDKNQREIGYYIAKTDENRQDGFETEYHKKYLSDGFEQLSLLRIAPKESNQIRGISILNAAQEDIISLETAKNSFVANMILHSILSAFITKEKDAPEATINSIDTIKGVGVKQEEGDFVYDEKDVALGTGNIVELNPGEKIQTVEASVQGQSFEAFQKSVLSQIGAAVGVPYEIMLDSFNSSFSASKGTISAAYKGFKIMSEELGAQLVAPMWEMIIDHGIRNGDIEAPGYLEATEIQRRSILACTFITPRQIVLDPTRDYNALSVALDNNLITHERAIRETTGEDFEEVIKRKGHEKREMEKHGLSVTPEQREIQIDDENDKEEEDEENTDE